MILCLELTFNNISIRKAQRRLRKTLASPLSARKSLHTDLLMPLTKTMRAFVEDSLLSLPIPLL